MGSRRIRFASPWLRACLFGGGLHPDILFATQLVGLLSRVASRRPLVWHPRPGSPSHPCTLGRGWQLVSSFHWLHGLTCQRLNFSDRVHVGLRRRLTFRRSIGKVLVAGLALALRHVLLLPVLPGPLLP